MNSEAITELLSNLERTKGKQTIVELQTNSEKLFTLLDNQELLPDPIKKQLWKLYLSYSKYQASLKN
ncbi:hypothetical protein LV84_00476 [Algoriphagus ratkowskyi]|uniref:Uncharacterized protein n=1 Tax=Algoriphagus ratkowskyi TaxID=57028 RepID=A0A2W7RMK1_9BACT|nr:hypothetical protein LV84_00476 [Algoriphagus ratkowskyi]